MMTADLLQDPWASGYVAQALVIAAALGIAFFSMPRTLGGTGAARFALGLACYPAYVALTTATLMTLIPGAPSAIFIAVPLAGALAAACFSVRRFPARACRRAVRAMRAQPIVRSVALLVAIGIFASAGVKLAINASHRFVEHDSLVYAQEALQLAASRAGSDLARASAQAHVAAGHPHTALYQAYLAHALLFGTDARHRVPEDLPARIAVQTTIAAMLMAVVSLGCLARIAGAAALALALTLVVADFGYVSVASSRDGLRIGSILVLCYLLVHALRTPHRIRRSTGIALALGVCIAASAHTLNLVAIALAGLAWFAVAVVRRHAARRIVIGASWITAGLALPATHYLVMLAETGRPFGHGFYYYAYVGTPLWDAWHRSQSIAASHAMGLFERFSAVAQRGSVSLFVIGIAAAMLLGWAALRRSGRTTSLYAFIATVTLLMLVPLTGILDMGGNALAAMHVANFRYFLVWYPLAALAIVALVASIGHRPLRSASVVVALLIAGVFSARTIQHWNVQQGDNFARYGIEPISAAVANESDVARVWIDHAGLRYYLRRPTVFAYQPPGSQVLRADSPAQAAQSLRELGVSHVILSEPIQEWWGNTALYRLLSEDHRLLLKSGLHALYKIAPTSDGTRAPSASGASGTR